jgi:hypothetical protein
MNGNNRMKNALLTKKKEEETRQVILLCAEDDKQSGRGRRKRRGRSSFGSYRSIIQPPIPAQAGSQMSPYRSACETRYLLLRASNKQERLSVRYLGGQAVNTIQQEVSS